MDSISMSVLIKLVQIFVIVPLSVSFIIFNRLSRTKHWAWDLFWGTYALNRIAFFFFWYKGTYLWFFLNIALLTLEAFSLNELFRFYTGKSSKLGFFSSLLMFPVAMFVFLLLKISFSIRLWEFFTVVIYL
ncbi:hypothetical protein AT15_08725 [Kosmotoga arenicorallina S304]|uniref:Uncharacterized protein n=1 Tax=Kosmotoga arenicorallina S304 TaxID=1453497 RepID=A0A176K1M7_9BACT|nr:hypothetical protein [Kosmotoga arenicorallina]OAA31048.1 hypothetical protein AT15_08725 [Kosmotoga arenicorallina S304]